MAATKPKPKRRKLELYKLTISGMRDDVDYQEFLFSLWANLGNRQGRIFTPGGKGHSLDQLREIQGHLWFQFFSFSEGERPEVLDTEDMSISENPLTDSEALLHWTHALGKRLLDRYVILLERVQTGIWPTKVEHYLQWLIDNPTNKQIATRATANSDEPISVSLELEPDASFLKVIDSMERVISASVRIVRPNPGWGDYEDLLSDEAKDSDAHSAEVTMNARRGASLSMTDGIIEAMREGYRKNKLGRAVVEGDVDGERKRVTTASHGKSQYKYLETNENGNVLHQAALDKFFEALGKMTDNV